MGSTVELPNYNSERIAIIGSACRLPGSTDSPSKLWELLKAPRDLIKKIPSERFSGEGFYNSNGDYHGNSNAKTSYFLDENIRQFDAPFFRIKPTSLSFKAEAAAMDPQQRLLLETVYEALEAGGQRMEDLQGSPTAAYVGCSLSDYDYMLLRDTDALPTYHATGIHRSIVANRVSYFFDWNGPSMTIDTACSSSLVALHQAVQALRAGSIDLAIAAGTNLILGPENYIAESKLKMLSPTGRSRMFDASADGYARGEGVVSVLVKRLSDAIRDGDAIECVIRETGINQDGRTNGITMPNPQAQARLIRQVYARAGLDPRKQEDRCQYFECHGTGTPTGDPLEAQAIREAFFGDGGTTEVPLYVGSIKTVVGHTEATAGLAGLMKASLALRHGVVPPNMLFEKLNPRVEPFYRGYMCVPTEATPWPDHVGPRRASVNSFGFGGANAHCILESWDSPKLIREEEAEEQESCRPLTFVMAANSQVALKKLHTSYADFLRTRLTEEPDNHKALLKDLAWTLSCRRTQTLPVRSFVAAPSVAKLIEKLDNKDNSLPMVSPRVVNNRASGTLRILGVFTGQGAQWAAMGKELLQTSSFARRRITQLDGHLQQLADPPTWTIADVLTSGTPLNTASLSQPLCCAIQILLVDLLAAAGVRFHSVVGHSSGEIAAAYAVGHLSDKDAMTAAFYRGVHSMQVKRPGKMMAVATSRADAQHLCSLRRFRGRICVAAHNGPNSVTLSGDEDAIFEAKVVFEDEDKTARVLFVDRAYHSHHMLPCADTYREALLLTRSRTTSSTTRANHGPKSRWFSSVFNKEMTNSKVDDEYWNANMIGEVRFADALRTAWTEAGPCDAVVEVGPHAALRAPAVATLVAISPELKDVPYTGSLVRGKDSAEALALTLGFLWAHLGAGAVDLDAYQRVVYGTGRKNALVTDLPHYVWDHHQEYWHESRVSRAFRARAPTHELLGNLVPDGTPSRTQRWSNYLCVNEVPWLDGHRVQGQAVFPAAGYICMALHALGSVLKARPVHMLEVYNVAIDSALAFPEDDVAVETLFELTDIAEDKQDGVLTAKFHLSAASGTGVDVLVPKASGSVRAVFRGSPARARGAYTLPCRPAQDAAEPMMKAVDSERFYSGLSTAGFGYSGPFKGMSGLRRKAGLATGEIVNRLDVPLDDARKGTILQPAFLDLAFQAIMLAYCYPDDGRLWAVHVPRNIHSIKISPRLCEAHLCGGHEQPVSFPFDAAEVKTDHNGVIGDVDVYDPNGGNECLVSVEGLHFVPLETASPDNDTRVFSKTIWAPATPDLPAVMFDGHATERDHDLALDLERACLCYMRQWMDAFPPSHPIRNAEAHNPLRGLLRYTDHVLDQVSSGQHRHAPAAWLMDDPEPVLAAIARKHGPDCLDLRMVNVVGQAIPAVLRGETTMLEHMLHDDLLSRYYRESLGMKDYTRYLSRGVKQLVHRYPNMQILEVGGGTGHATKSILSECEGKFRSYTFTDVSPGFFPTAEETFVNKYAGGDRMQFRVLDMEKDPLAQGFQLGHYDLIVASFVLHITQDLKQTLANMRKLLKPGGFLVLAELTDNDVIRSGFIFGSLPGWWIGETDGRVLSPCIEPAAWDVLLRECGFSGADSVSDEQVTLPRPASIIVSQAVDQQVLALRDPITVAPPPVNGELIIIGGLSLVNQVEATLMQASAYTRIQRYASLLDLSASCNISTAITRATSILNLSDLDEPVFRSLTQDKLAVLKAIVEQAKTIVWFTSGRRSTDPYANMSVGFGRSLFWEIPDLRLEFVDLEDWDLERDCADLYLANLIASDMLRFELSTEWKATGQLDPVSVLWSVELEVIHKKTTQQQQHPPKYSSLIPRLVGDQSANDRYNATKRKIEELVDVSRACVEAPDGVGADLQQGLTMAEMQTAAAKESMLLLHVEHSSTWPVPVDVNSHLYVLAGRLDHTGQMVLALSDKVASSVLVCKEHVHIVSCSDSSVVRLLSLAIDTLVATHLVAGVEKGRSLLIHEPSLGLALVMSRVCKDIEAYFTTTTLTEQYTSSSAAAASWIHLPSRIHPRHISKILPRPSAIGKYVDFSDHSSVGVMIEKHMQGVCKRLDGRAILSSQHQKGYLVSAMDKGDHSQQLIHASTVAQDVVAIMDEPSLNLQAGSPQVFSWPQSRVPVVVKPVGHSSSLIPLFRPDRSYWLVGLTGDLGLSLCEWMLRHGARYVVLSSRNPKVDAAWQTQVQQANENATVVVLACDVTSQDAVRACYETIRSTLPPLAGVAQAAMVLHDSLIKDMTSDKMRTVLAPKVDGSLHLCNAVAQQEQTNPLDFFIFFSSMAGLVGNLGQSNYSAANAFMMSLAAQRRSRGLAASVVNIGVIVGIGYITREVSDATLEDVREGGYMFLPEQAFHAMFGEAVLASHPQSGREVEISTGVAHVAADDGKNRPIWFENPRFSHHVVPTTTGMQDQTQKNNNNSSSSSGGDALSLELRLAGAASAEDVFGVVKAAFISKLANLLKLDQPDSEATLNARAHMPLSDFGIDSLIAVEVRKWFLKALSVNVPVLKILGGASITDVVSHAVSQLKPAVAECSGDGDAQQQPSLQQQHHHQQQQEVHLQVEEALSTKEERSGPLSHSQSMFWFLHQLLTDDSTALNHTGSSRITGPLDISTLALAVKRLTQRHEILRTRFYMDEKTGAAVQAVMTESRVKLQVRRLVSSEEPEQQVARVFEELQSQWTYDLEHGEAMRLVLLTSDDDNESTQQQPVHYLVVGFHHIIVDGASLPVFMRHLADAYCGAQTETKLQYLEYATGQAADQATGLWEPHLDYWRSVFVDDPNVLPFLALPGAKMVRPEQQNNNSALYYKLHRSTVTLSKQLTMRINEAARQLQSTPFHFYLAVFRVLLVRLTQSEDLCIGIATANRPDNASDSIGPFVNLVPLRLRSESAPSFAAMLHDTRATALNALEHASVPFTTILDSVASHVPSRSAQHSPLFQAFVDYREGGVVEGPVPFGDSGLSLELLQQQTGQTGYDVNVDIAPFQDGGCKIDVMLQSSLYSEEDTQMLGSAYEALLDEFSKAPQQNVLDPSMFSTETINAALELGAGPIIDSSWPETLMHRIAAIPSAEPHSTTTAIQDGYGSSLSYSQMLHRVAVIASALTDDHLGIEPNSIVAVYQDRTADCICSLLAILCAGMIYVPLDARPDALTRAGTIAADCKPAAVLVDKSTRQSVTQLGLDASTHVIDLTTIAAADPAADVPAAITVKATALDPAVILYTSGSTGTPKGVRLSHANLRNEVEFAAATYKVQQDEHVLQQSALSFDMSLTQIFSALAYGGTLHVVPSSMHADAGALAKMIAEQNITLTGATPSEYLAWIQAGGDEYLKGAVAWKTVICGGEPLGEGLVRAFRSIGVSGPYDKRTVFNAYGPAEVTCSSNRRQVDIYNDSHLEYPLAVGKPAPNVRVLIVEPSRYSHYHHLHPLPIGCVGEVVVGGAGVAMGYHNHNNNNNNNKFQADPFHQGQRLHRTGDLGKLLPDGQLLVLGRMGGDDQVKVNGIRISPQEVELAILQAGKGKIMEAVVSKRVAVESGVAFLVAHVVLGSELQHLDASTVPLALPRTMWPSLIIPVESLPRGATGKIDRASVAKWPLPAFAVKEEEEEGRAGEQPTAVDTMKDFWAKVLPRDVFTRHTITPNSDFFRVGGSSLLLVELRQQIQKQTGRRLRLDQMFGASTLKDMASLVEDGAVKVESEGQQQQIDWAVETAPPPLVCAPALPDSSRSSSIPDTLEAQYDPTTTTRTVILTGATGQLGTALLSRLLDSPTVSKVHCIAVRDLSKLACNATHPKLHVLAGDLSEPGLGLDPATAAKIFAAADVIIHNGAQVNFLQPYHRLRATNVDSTRALLRLALLHQKRRTDFHYISSAAVLACTEISRFGERSVRGFLPDGLDGYAQTKWASEALLEATAAQFGSRFRRAVVHRPSHVAAAAAAKSSGTHHPDLLQNLLDHCGLIGAVPRMEKVQGCINIVGLDECAAGIVDSVLAPWSNKEEGAVTAKVSYRHHIGTQEIMLDAESIRKHLEADRESGSNPVKTVTLDEWTAKANAAGLQHDLALYLQGIEQGHRVFTYLPL